MDPTCSRSCRRCSSRPASNPRRLPPARRRRGWLSALWDSMRCYEPSLTRTSTSRPSVASIDQLGTRSADRSSPDYFALMAERLAGVFPDFTVEVFPDRHHFDPPHRIEPARVATSLRSLWARAEHV
jgi:hypothetical protein